VNGRNDMEFEVFRWGKFYCVFYRSYVNFIQFYYKIKSMRMKWVRHVAYMEQETIVYKILVGNPEGKRSVGRSRCTLEDDIKMDFGYIGYDNINSIHLC
jgi:hypothetical protein